MTVYLRIILYIIAGHLASAGWLNDELRNLMWNDPDAVALIQGAIAGLPALGSLVWWRLAKRFGWST